MLFTRFFKKQVDFFALFKDASLNLVETSVVTSNILSHPSDAPQLSRKLVDLEHKGDAISRHAITLLHSTFITPLDREHIIGLIRLLDDVVDLFEAIGQRIDLFKIEEVPARMKELAQVNELCAREVYEAIVLISNLKNSDQILIRCATLHQLENQADTLLRQLLVDIFEGVNDIKRVIQLKELAELLEQVSDTCEDIANLLETIVLEYS